MAPRKYGNKKRMFKSRRKAKVYRSINKSKYQVHRYKRYTHDFTFYNVNPTGTADLLIDVDGTSRGKVWQGVQLGSLIGGLNNTSQIGGSIAFDMDMITGLNDFNTLYDRYKVSGYKVTFIPLQNMATPASGSSLPTLTYCFDGDDSNIPLDDLELRQRANCKIRRLDKPVSIYVKPKINMEALGITGSVNLPSYPKYIDMSQTDILHRGLKFWIDGMDLVGGAGLVHFYKIVIKAYFKCAETR